MPTPITGGIWPAVLTCWNHEADTPNDAAQIALTEAFIEQDLDGLYLLGSTGRGVAIGSEHRKHVTEVSAKANAGRLPLMVHVGAVSTVDAVDLAKHAADQGADAISAVPPFYFKVEVDDVFEHYRRIAEATDLPFFPYHHSALGAPMPDAPEYARRLLELPNVAGIKFTSHDFFTFMRIRLHAGDKLVMFSGADELMCQGVLADSDGAIGTFYNVWGQAIKRIRQRLLAGEAEAAKQFMLTFAGALESALFPRKHLNGFIRTAVKLRTGVDIGTNRSCCDFHDEPWDEQEVREIMDTVDAAAGL